MTQNKKDKMISISKKELKEIDDDRGYSGKTTIRKGHWDKLVASKKDEKTLIAALKVEDKRSKKVVK